MPLRWWRGATSAAGTLTIPVGRFGCRGIERLSSPERFERGLVLVLPGIQGKSYVESSVARGLDDASVELAAEVFDWTTGYWMLFPYHLRGLTRNRRIAATLAERVCEYRRGINLCRRRARSQRLERECDARQSAAYSN